uniref:Polybia-CP n=1 Tax=Polybia paulista TaxID=291283 RepID=PROTO_POLPI|nr:RecName: Full=Polybia-CP; AltName: Full=Pol-CP-NH2; AltName: Full=Polybia chemotactic peptide [Polybia paulista]
ILGTILGLLKSL